MINYLFEVSLCWTGFYLFYVLLLSKETFFHLNRGYLLSTLLLGLALPLIDLSAFLIGNNTPTIHTANYLETITVGVQSLEQNMEMAVISPIAESLSVLDLMLWIYWIGMAIMFLRFLVGFSQIVKLYFKSERRKEGKYTLVLTNGNHLPFSFFHLFFKSKNLSLSDTDQEKITQHELAHIEGKHSIDVLLLELVSILLWCSPLIHFYKKSIRNIHEYVADANVLRNTSKKHYGQLLLQVFQNSPGIALANNFIHSQLKKRIKMMTKTQSSKKAYWKYLVALPLIGILVFVLTKADAIAQTNNSPATSKISKPIHPVLKNEQTSDPIFTVVEQMPRFPGCEDIQGDQETKKNCSNRELIQFMGNNITYPESAKKNNIEGIVVIRFIVDKEGKIASPELLRTLDPECDAEAMRVVKMMPQFTPGKQNGKNVNVYFTLPVRYKLTGDTPTEDKLEMIPPPAPPAAPKAPNAPKNIPPPPPPAPPVPSDCDMFAVVDEMPRFPGCEHLSDDRAAQKECSDKGLLNFIYKNVEYPKAAQKAGTEGMVVVSFTVSKEGEILNPEIKRSIGNGCDEAVLNVVELMNGMEQTWTAGKQNGKKVNVQYNMPVKFKLADDAAPKSETAAFSKKDNTLGVLTMNVSPNPVGNKQVTIEFELYTQPKNLKLQIVDINGKEIVVIQDANFGTMAKNIVHLDLSKAAPGVIFISLIDGNKIYTEQLMKQ